MKLLALPIMFGGMGIVMPSEICDDEYQNSLSYRTYQNENNPTRNAIRS